MESRQITNQKSAISNPTSPDALALLGLLAFMGALFAGVLFQDAAVCLGRPDGDARSQFYGWRAYGFGQVREGRFPLWNPYEFLGIPFVAALQSAMFYPPNWLCAIMPLGRAINLGILITIYLSAAFAYLWVRRLGLGRAAAIVAGLSYALGAPQFLRIFEGHWSFLASMPSIPAILWCVEELVTGRARWLAVAGGAGAVALQLFGGNPQYALYGGVATVLYFAVRLWQERNQEASRVAQPPPVAGEAGVDVTQPRAAAPHATGQKAALKTALRAIAGFAGMYALGAALAGIQLIPALELLRHSSRAGQLTYEWVTQYSLTPESLITLLVPDFWGSDVGQTYWGRWNLWEMSAYAGVVTAGLALIGIVAWRRKWSAVAAGVALCMLVLALGRYTPLLRLLYHTTPGFALFRSLSRCLGPFSLFLALLAGIGADALLCGGEEVTRTRRVQIALVALSAIVGVFIGLGLLLATGYAQDAWVRFMRAMLAVGPGQRLYLDLKVVNDRFILGAMRGAGWSLLRSGGFLAALASVEGMVVARKLNRSAATVAIVALVALDLWGFSRRYLVTFDPRVDGLTPGALAYLENIREPFRYARGGDFRFPPCEGMSNGLACIEGIQPNVPARFRDVFWSFQGRSKDEQRTVYSIYAIEPPLRMLNLRYLVQSKSTARTVMPGIRTVYEDERVRIEELPNGWPRAWLVHGYVVEPDKDKALGMMKRLNYERFALFEEDPGVPVAPPLGPEPLPRIVRYEANRAEIEVQAASPAFLVLSDLHFPGWKAALDGAPVPLLRANYLLRAVYVPEGKHTVAFVFDPASFRVGIAASLVGLAGVGALVGLHVRKKRAIGDL